MSLRTKTKIPVIYYHSVGVKNTDWGRSYLTLDFHFFEDQIKFISKNYSVISLNDYFLIRKGDLPPVKNALVITFDDGYLDNWIWAFPVLKRHGLKATIFISPEFIDDRDIVRANLEDVWNNKAEYKDLSQWGFLSWNEMKIMEASGLIDIESHTMTHTKYIVSSELVGFHNPCSDSANEIWNRFPETKSGYINNPDFQKLLPYGFPLFKVRSSVIARRVVIKEEFTERCVDAFKNYDFSRYSFNSAYKLVEPIYRDFLRAGIVESKETTQDYEQRMYYEIAESKRIIEINLNKEVRFLCWPHGDNSSFVHQLALRSGYLATTAGSNQLIPGSTDRIQLRVGLSHSRNNRYLTKLKTHYKIGLSFGMFPWKQINWLYRLIRYRETG